MSTLNTRKATNHKNTTFSRSKPKSYDAQVESDNIERLRKVIRMSVEKNAFHDLAGKYRQILKESDDALTIKSQLAFALQRHSLKCEICSPKRRNLDLKKSTDLYQSILEVEPTHGPSLLGLARPLKGKAYETAVRRIIRLTQDPAYYTHLGHHFRTLKDYERSEKYFRKALPSIPHHYGIMYALATLYTEMGNKSKAKRYARHALDRLKHMNNFYQSDPITCQFKRELKYLIKSVK